MNLKNKVIVITGGSKGLGKELATLLIQEGSKVIVSARAGRELKQAAHALGAIPFVADVQKESDVKKIAAYTLKKFGRIDVWINNAGIVIPRCEIEDINVAKAHRMMEVNFFGTFYGSREALKVMKKRKHGVIMNIISASSLVGRPLSAGYAASKWAARGFTESLRLALKSHHIKVIAVHPFGFKTKIFGSYIPAGYDNWMPPAYVAGRIVKNLKQTKPKLELVIGHD